MKQQNDDIVLCLIQATIMIYLGLTLKGDN